jgi:putative colanic acid biosynthesis UDP-glucose lipid carrier transferase
MQTGILKRNASLLGLFSRISDIVLIFVSAALAYYLRFGSLQAIPQNYYWATLIGAMAGSTALWSLGMYQSMRGKRLTYLLFRLLIAWLLATLTLSFFAFSTKTGEQFSRGWLASWVIVGFVLSALFRLGLFAALRWLRKQGFNHRKVVIFGAGRIGKRVADGVAAADWTGYKIIGFFDDRLSQQGAKISGVTVERLPEDLESYFKLNSVDELWLALPLSAEQRIKEILYQLRFSTVNIRLIPDLFSMELINHTVSKVAGMTTLDLRTSPMRGMNRLLKALEDRALALIILILISPALLLLTVLVKCTSQGPAIFKQKRYGWDGKLITVYKFRSMYLHGTDGVKQATQQDDRITPIGRFMRRTSLDELPQFINVLQGRMSIVGPRPHAVEHNEYYKNLVDRYMQRHMVKPGITGWAQVNGLRGETDTLEKMEKRIEYDLYYIENWSLWFDIKIVLLTIWKGFIHKNAY